tara:strand:- start:10265 stop:10876 length:612 start_codon:yes stop_codon:yes gene_type:complete
MKANYHKSCTTLPIYNFYKIIEESNLLYLAKNYIEEETNDIEIGEDAEEHLNNILEEYSILTANKEILFNLKLQKSIKLLEYERNIISGIIDIYKETEDNNVLQALLSLGFEIRPSENIEDLLKRAIKRIKGLNNKIRINKIKYTKRFSKKNSEGKSNLEKEALILEMNLKLGREINVRKTSVSKWVNMVNLSSDIIKQNKNG